jgi:hypothetical protein
MTVDTALADVGRSFGAGADEGEDSCPRFPHAAVRAGPFQPALLLAAMSVVVDVAGVLEG